MIFKIYKLGELGEVSFGMLKLGELGEGSFDMLKLGELGEVIKLEPRRSTRNKFKSTTLDHNQFRSTYVSDFPRAIT